MKSQSSWFYYFKNNAFEPLLHELIPTNTTRDIVTDLATHVRAMCYTMVLSPGVHYIYAIITRLIDFNLSSGLAADKLSLNYQRNCISIALHLLAVFPRYVIQNSAKMAKLFHEVQRLELLESVDGRVKQIADIYSLGYYIEFSRSGIHIDLGRMLAAGKKVVQQWMDKEVNEHPVFMRSVMLRFTVFLGYVTSEQRDKDSAVTVWQKDAVDLLDVYCRDTDSKIQSYAWNVDVDAPISLSDFSHLTPKISTGIDYL